MIQEVIVSQPGDPLEHMINFLHRENDDGKSQSLFCPTYFLPDPQT